MKKIFLSLILILGYPVLASAHPPTEIHLTYEGTNLHVEVIHTTIAHTRHYIRKITISKDKHEVQSQYFHQQVDPAKFVQDFKIEAKPGDVLVVEAFSSQGGSLSASLIVPTETAEPAPSSHADIAPPVPDGRPMQDSNPYSP